VEVRNPEKVATGGVKAASAGLMAAGLACPPAGLAGAAIYAGVSLYEHREGLGKALRTGGDFVRDAGGALLEGLKEAPGKVAEAFGRLLGD
ncbi:MAG: hypothetical protein AB1758_13685, partial [Candidatus Eremiobacterota bacterium]